MEAFESRPLPGRARQLALLLKVQIRALLASFGLVRGGARKRRASLVAGAVVLTLVVSLNIATYLFALGVLMGGSGKADAIPAAAALVGGLPTLVVVLAKANGAFFGLRDYDLIMSAPVSARVVVLSRIVPLYLVELATAVVTMLPLYLAYALFVPLTAVRLALMVASVLLVPLVPTCVAAALSFLISMLAARLRHFRALALALGAVLVAGGCYGYLWLSFSFGSLGANQVEFLVRDLSELVQALSRQLWPPAAWLADAMEVSLPSGLLFVGVSLIVPFACLEFLARRFMALNSALRSRGRHQGLRATERRSARGLSPFRALLAKELGCLAGTPSCVFNILAGDLMLLGAAIFLAFFAPRDLASLSVDGVSLAQLPLPGMPRDVLQLIVPWGFALFALSVPFAACATSLEGRAAWIMSCAPQPSRAILGAKMLTSMAHLVATSVVSALLLTLTGRIGPLVALECVLVTMGYGCLTAAIGLWVDVRSPNYAWSSPTEVVKRGVPVVAAFVSGMVAVACVGLVVGWALLAAGLGAAHLAHAFVEVLMLAAGVAIFFRACRQPLYL